MQTLRTMSILCVWACCAWLAACSSKPPKPQAVKLSLSVAADVNPDSQSRPSPIVVRVYQLKDDTAFKDADFFTLYDKEQGTLSAALLSREEFELVPGDHRVIDYQLPVEARFVGVAAAFRDIRNAEWRAEIGAPDKGLVNLVSKNKIDIVVERARVSIAPN